MGGGRLQAAIPKGPRPLSAGRANGLNLRGAVIRIFPRDAPPPGTPAPAATYATVLTYGRIRTLLPRVQVSSEHASLHTGTIGGLRAVQTTSGGILDVDHSDPGQLDCSHVVVSFLDDDLSQPYISRVLEHPRADGGGPIAGPVQDRTRLATADGAPLLIRWNGATWGIDGAGDFLIDLENAHDGGLIGTGQEPPPATDGARGNARIHLPVGSRLELTVGGGATVLLEMSEAGARLVLGDGAFSAAVAEHLEALWTQLATYLHTQFVVLTSLGPSGTAAAAGAPAPPAWDPRIASDKLKLPDTTPPEPEP
jgi:hypothetical protein